MLFQTAMVKKTLAEIKREKEKKRYAATSASVSKKKLRKLLSPVPLTGLEKRKHTERCSRTLAHKLSLPAFLNALSPGV